jgi:GNAT superfamily N-acetyltransferase
MKIEICRIDKSTRALVVDLIHQNWGSKIIITRGKKYYAEQLDGFVALVNGEIKGIITYNIEKEQCEIVSLDSFYERVGIGSALIESVVQIAKYKNCSRIWLITTNDNGHAMRFYQKRGFELSNIHLFAIEHSRKLKPEIPLKGFDDIPILHEIEFEKNINEDGILIHPEPTF